MAGPSLVRSAHGTAAAGGALLVVETPPLDETRPPDATRTEEGLALRKARGRPFTPGNAAGSNRGPSLTYIVVDPNAPDDEKRRRRRKASSLQRTRKGELEVQYGVTVSSGVKVELCAWARATSWAEYHDQAGDGFKAAALDEKASAHGLKAIAIVEREAASRPKKSTGTDGMRARVLGKGAAAKK